MSFEQSADLQESETRLAAALAAHRRSALRWAFATWTLCCLNTLLLGALIYADNRRTERMQHELLAVVRRASTNTDRLRILVQQQNLNALMFRTLNIQLQAVEDRLTAQQRVTQRAHRKHLRARKWKR